MKHSVSQIASKGRAGRAAGGEVRVSTDAPNRQTDKTNGSGWTFTLVAAFVAMTNSAVLLGALLAYPAAVLVLVVWPLLILVPLTLVVCAAAEIGRSRVAPCLLLLAAIIAGWTLAAIVQSLSPVVS